jgi:hypothetical protein
MSEALAIKLEPFVTAEEVLKAGLFPGLSLRMLNKFAETGIIRSHGPQMQRTYLLSEVYEDWKNFNRSGKGYGRPKAQARQRNLGSGLQKAWRSL